MKITQTMTSLSLALLATASLSVQAAPIQLTANGSVIDANGSRAADLGTAFSADIILDLDEVNAFAKEFVTPSDEAPFTRWTFFNEPYNVNFDGNFGNLNSNIVIVETLNDFDADADGNPFGITGIVDVVSIFGSNIVVDCSAGTVHPVTGCDDPDAPWDYGQEIAINLIGASNWFNSDDSLPVTIPDFSSLVGVFGSGVDVSGGAVVGDLTVEYTSLEVSAVPVPAAAWLFGSGLLGLIGIARRR